MTKVSVCIPSYKQASFLERCLNSISAQTYTDYEIVVSDDSPNDEIEQLIKKYEHIPVLYRKNRTPLGSPENWNNAIRMASGEYIKIMHHDDWFSSPSSLEDYVDLLDKNPDSYFAFSACRDIGKEREIAHHPNNYELNSLKKNPDILSLGNFVGAPSTTIFRRNVDMFFDKNLIWFVDIEFYIRLLRKFPSFVYSNKELVYIGISENQISNYCVNNEDLITKERNYFFEKLNIKYGIGYGLYRRMRRVIIIKTLIKWLWK
ncbi:MAG: glycosyltransferase [Dysgonamonadaceae bacterium]|jgi:glycosyltransferase involved in cell wall biosynthesis|nr:glycosyltransferase [Dysgonamonadaceae bacterium]